MYKITQYSYDQAKKLNVSIKLSTVKNKKIDVFDRDNKKLVSIGDIRYKDYPTYILEKGIEFANERRRLYRIRHKDDLKKIGSPGYFANKILW